VAHRSLAGARWAHHPLRTGCELAGYPKPPKSALGAPLYAWQVRQRRRALEIELAAARRRLEKAEIERDRQLALIAERQRNELQGDERFEALLARIRDMDNSVTARSEELTRLKGEYERKCEEHARRLQNAKQAFTGLLADEQKQRGVFERAKVDYERAAAKFKRATIEHRAALQRSEAAAKAGGGMAATTTGELSSLQQRIAETKPEMDRFQAEMLRTRDAHKASYERAKAGEENIARLEEERAALDRDYQRDRDTVTGRLANQQNSRNKALADVARMMLARKTAKLQSGELERLLVADREVKDASFAAEGLARGAETYDRDAFNRGKLLGLSAVGLLFVVVALGLVMALRSRPAASTDAPAGAPTLEGLKPWKPSDYKD